ncbi:DUF4013 domain-containing protein [Methanobrevibacter sp. DSM 116169]|uniref:DUF4013 domain-containing protein n=1 Tax=Methanobrevibacter sp. DSM 116169 TaxID=3242727 RepID=UPI0038FBF4A9
MILDIYKDSLEYAIKDGTAILKLGLMSILSFLILPIFLFFGYNYRVIKTATHGTINGDDDVPNFDDLVSMFIEGIQVFLIKFIYSIIPMLTFFILLVIGGSLGEFNDELGNVVVILGMIITIIVAIISALFALLAIPRMAYNDDSIKEAFNFKEIFDSIKLIGVLRLIGFLIGLLIIGIVIVSVITGIFLLAFGLIGGLGAFIASWDGALFGLFSSFSHFGTMVFASFIVLFIIYSIIITPFLNILNNRAIGLIYEELDNN